MMREQADYTVLAKSLLVNDERRGRLHGFSEVFIGKR